MQIRDLVLAAALAAAVPTAASAQAARRNSQPAAPTGIVTPSGQTWEKIPLNYIDVRVLTAITGAPNLPTEWDLYRMRYGGMAGGMGMGGPGMGGYGMGGYGGGFGIQPGGFGMQPGGFGMQPGGFQPGGGPGGWTVFGDPNSNSLVVGPGRGVNGSRMGNGGNIRR